MAGIAGRSPGTGACIAHGRARRVLLAWELGEGLGHAARLLSIALRLQADGWSPVVAARHPSALAERYAAARVPVIAAPAHRSCFKGPGAFRASTYADVMGVCGYADLGQLADSVKAWDTLLNQQAPALVIADYAPLLSLAAFGRMPLIAVGDGFVTPPALAEGGFPALGDSPPVWEPAALLDAARRVQAVRGLPPPESLAQIIEGVGQVVSVPPELDIYAATRPTPAAGPWNHPEPPLASPQQPRVFAYLHPSHPLAGRVLQALARLRIPGECYLPEATDEVVAQVRQAGIEVHAKPPPLRDTLGRASLLIHHGGIGSLEVAALAGRAQLLLPRHLEQSLNTRRALAALPATVTVGSGVTLEKLAQGLPDLVRDASLMRAAQLTASRMAARRQTAWDALRRLMAKIV